LKKIEIKTAEWKEDKQQSIGNKTNIKIPDQLWKPLAGVTQPKVIRQFDGVNELSPTFIKETFATEISNFSSNDYPAMSVRDGFRNIGQFSAGIRGIALYRGQYQNELHGFQDGSWWKYDFDSENWTSLGVNLDGSSSYRYASCHFKGNFSDINLIVSSGIYGPYKYDGTSVTLLANAPTSFWYLASHDNRVYGAAYQTVYFCALRKAEDWQTVNDAGQIVIDGDSENITGIVSGPEKLTVFKTNTMYELFGNGPSSYQLKQVANVGTLDGHSIQIIDNVMYFVALDGIYKYTGGTKPTKVFSMPIQKYLDFGEHDPSIPVDYKISSWQYNGCYYVQVNNSTTGFNILEYNTKTNVWSMLNYPFYVEANGFEFNKHIFLPVSDDPHSSVMEIGSDYTVDYTDNAKQGLTGSQTPISWKWISKPFHFESSSGKMKLMKLWITADIKQGSKIDISISPSTKGNSDWTLLQSITAAKDYLNQEIIVPVNWKPPQNFYRIKLSGTGKATIYEVTRQERDYTIGVF
jgi:hypothetical protein